MLFWNFNPARPIGRNSHLLFKNKKICNSCNSLFMLRSPQVAKANAVCLLPEGQPLLLYLFHAFLSFDSFSGLTAVFVFVVRIMAKTTLTFVLVSKEKFGGFFVVVLLLFFLTEGPIVVVTNRWSCNAIPKALWFPPPSCLQVSGALASAACLTVQNSLAGLSQEFREHCWVTSLSHCTSLVPFSVRRCIVLEVFFVLFC